MHAVAATGASLLLASNAAAAARTALADLSLEELANIQITTVSKRPEPLADAPASVFVMTGDEIRRSGAATLPEVMRLAPNLQVARLDARNYAMTARGFNNPFANKLLVLIDGRTVYSPLFSGVFWDAQDVVLEDISRIEVISGPGATLWGANAVNGVINIITRSAAETQGRLAVAGVGNNEKTGVLRHGGALDGGGHYRVYGKYAEGDDSRNAAGAALPTGWRRRQAGFRSDWSDQAQHAIRLGRRHQMVWGGGYRLAFDHVRNEAFFGFLPGSKTLRWGNIFVQDEVELPRNFRLTAGLKLESNSYTATELLPTLRLAWKPADNQLLWASASRAVRTPSRIDRDFFSPTNPPVQNGVAQYVVAGGPDFQSEIANVLELGYRAQPSATLSYSATVFASRYDKLRTLEPNPAGPGVTFSNQATDSAQGIEAWGTWQAAPAWRLSAGGVVQQVRTALLPGSRDISGATGLANGDPSNHWMIRSSLELAPGQELDFTLRHAGALQTPAVPAYTTVDMRYGWQIQRNLELSVAARNLLDRGYTEFGAGAGASVDERSVFVRLAWRS